MGTLHTVAVFLYDGCLRCRLSGGQYRPCAAGPRRRLYVRVAVASIVASHVCSKLLVYAVTLYGIALPRGPQRAYVMRGISGADEE